MGLKERWAAFRVFVKEALGKDISELTRRDSLVVYPIRFFIYIGRELGEDNCFQQASSLAFKTIISLVPLMAVAFSLFKFTGAFENAESKLIGLMVSLEIIPVSAEEIAGQLTALTRNISAGAVGSLGMVILVAVAVALFDNVERVFNDIFKVEHRRSVVVRFLTFYAILTLGPLAVAGSLYFTGGIERQFAGGPVAQFFKGVFVTYMLPFLISWVGLTFMYRFLPNTHVRFRAAMSGAALSAFFFELAKVAFRLYVTHLVGTSWGKIYGALALFPIFLIWIYIAWVITLFGAEVAYTLQNMHILMQADQERRTRLAERIDDHFAARIFLEIARHFSADGGSVTREDLAVRFRITPGLIDLVCRRFIDAKLLLRIDGASDQQGYVLARPPDTIRISQVLGAFRVGFLQVADSMRNQSGQARFSDLWSKVEASRQSLIEGLTVQDLLEGVEYDRIPASTEPPRAGEDRPRPKLPFE